VYVCVCVCGATQALEETRATSDEKLDYEKDALARQCAWQVCNRQRELEEWTAALPRAAANEVTHHRSKTARHLEKLKVQQAMGPPRLVEPKKKPQPAPRSQLHANWVYAVGEWSERPEYTQLPPAEEERGQVCERHHHHQAAAVQQRRVATGATSPRPAPSTRPRLVPHANWMTATGEWSERPEIQEALEPPGEEPGPECPRYRRREAARGKRLGD